MKNLAHKEVATWSKQDKMFSLQRCLRNALLVSEAEVTTWVRRAEVVAAHLSKGQVEACKRQALKDARAFMS